MNGRSLLTTWILALHHVPVTLIKSFLRQLDLVDALVGWMVPDTAVLGLTGS